MNCEEANNIDLVNYLYSSGYTPAKIESIEYGYFYLLRFETNAAFKSDRNKNISYNHAMGNGSRVINFVIKYLALNGQTALQKLYAQITNSKLRLLLNKTEEKNKLVNIRHVDRHNGDSFSFQQQKDQEKVIKNMEIESPFHLHENSLINNKNAAETAMQIIAAKRPITDPLLCRYLYQKRINKNIVTTYSYEVDFKMENVDDFFNNSCIKNDFKNPVSSVDLKLKNVSQNHPKNNDQIDQIINNKFHPKQQSKANKSLTIFGCIFSLLNFHAICQNQKQTLTDILALNTLDLFEKIILLTEKYKQVQLYFRNNDGSKNIFIALQKHPLRFIDQSNLYKDYVSLNCWLTHFGMPLKVQNLQQSDEMRLP